MALWRGIKKYPSKLFGNGSPKRIDEWKTGFYYIAKGSNVPIVMATLDFGKKEVKIAEPYYLTDSMENDFNHFYIFYKGVKGKIPENFNL